MLGEMACLRRLCFYRCLSVHRGGFCLSAWDTPQDQAPPPHYQTHTPRADTPLPDQTPPGPVTPPRSNNPPWLRTVRILLECILVLTC